MPVTVKLSKLFQDRLGEEIADELVRWFNLVDATYRSELREINELNYARFEAKLEQRIGELRAELRAELRERMAELRAELREGLAGQRADLIKWMLIFWAGTIVPLAGLMFALQKL